MTNPQIENGHTDIANEIMEALARTRIPGEARQVLDYIMRKTWGWHKKEDEIPLSQFVFGTGIKKQNVCRALQKLKEMNIIFIKSDNDNGSSYKINKHYDTWRSLSKRITDNNTVIVSDKKEVSKTMTSKETNKRNNILCADFMRNVEKLIIDDVRKIYGMSIRFGNKHELIKSALVRIGNENGYTSMPEYYTSERSKKRIDCVWLQDGEPVVAFEIDQTVYPKSIDKIMDVGCGGFIISYGNNTEKINLRLEENVLPENIVHIRFDALGKHHAPLKTEKKIVFGEFQNVLLTDEEHERLVKDYGTRLVEDYIFKLGEYMKIHGKSYKDHNLTIRNWMRREGIGHINSANDGKRIVEL